MKRTPVKRINSLAGFPLKTQLLLIGIRVLENVKDGFRRMSYEVNHNSTEARWRREQDRKQRTENAFYYTKSTNYDLLLKGDDYSDWYREMDKIRQARRRARHPMNRGVFCA